MKLFKKSTLSLALTASLVAVGGLGLTTTTTVSAADQSSMTDSTGDVLLYPYYTIDNGFRTLFHLVNTSEDDTTIVKIRLRDFKNSDDVLDFTAILSPSDVFAGTIRDNGNGTVAFVKANDTTCTSPNINSFVPGFPISNGGSGHIEVITMATINKNLVGSATYPILNEIVNRTTHSSAGVNTSADCAAADIYFAKVGSGGKNIEALQEEMVDYTTNADPEIRSNLFGHYTVVDFNNGIQGGGRPSTLSRTLAGTLVSPCNETSAPNNTLVCGQFPEHFEFPHLAHVPGADPAGPAAANVAAFNAVYGVNNTGNLVSSGIMNEWTKNSADDGSSTVDSEWVVTLPTKYVYRDDYPADITGNTSKDMFAGAPYVSTESSKYDDTAAALFAANPTGIWDSAGCSNYDYFRYDREEQTDVPSSGTSTSGGQAEAPNAEKFCNEVAALTFGDFAGVTQPATSPVVFGINTNSLNQKFGWGGFGLLDNGGNSVSLPIIGYSMWNRNFGNAGNYGHIMDHVKAPEIF